MKDNNKKSIIESTFSPSFIKRTEITPQEIAAIKKLLGVSSLLIVCDDEERVCDEEFCKGHGVIVSITGFTKPMINGIGDMLGKINK